MNFRWLVLSLSEGNRSLNRSFSYLYNCCFGGQIENGSMDSSYFRRCVVLLVQTFCFVMICFFSLSEVFWTVKWSRSSLCSHRCRSQLINVPMESHVFHRWVFISLVYFSKNSYFWLLAFLFYHYWSISILSCFCFRGQMENILMD